MKIFGYEISRPKTKALSNYGQWQDLFIGNNSSGVTITNKNSLNISTVFACIRNISEDVAKVPFKVYQKTGDSKEKLPDHPLQKVLNRISNPEMTAMSFRQAATSHCLGWGNGYAEIVRDVYWNTVELYPLSPDKVTPQRNENGSIYYDIADENGQTRKLSADNVFHASLVRRAGSPGTRRPCHGTDRCRSHRSKFRHGP